MARQWNVCVVGATTLVGETLLELLEARSFPIGNLELVEAGEIEANPVNFRGEDHVVQALEDFDFAQCELAFFCIDPALAKEYVPKAVEAGAVVIDDSDAFRMQPDIPLVVPEVNAEALANYAQRRIVASPNSCATIMAMTLKPIQEAFGLSAINVVTLQSVSGVGKAAVEELARQSMSLFNQQDMAPDIFPKQIAFNLLPQIGAALNDGSTREEHKIAEETKRLLQNNNMHIDVTAVRVPVFYGHALALHVATERVGNAEELHEILEKASGLVVYEMAESGGYPTPVVEAAMNDPVLVGRIRVRSDGLPGFNLWAVADNTRKGSALNMVQIAEKMVEKYLA